jgi:hypothetical protein
MRQACRKYFLYSFILFLLWCVGCAHQLTPVTTGTYSDPQGRFVVTLPEGSWQMLSWEEVDCVLWDHKTGTTIVVDVTPFPSKKNDKKNKGEIDLINSTRHLIIAF